MNPSRSHHSGAGVQNSPTSHLRGVDAYTSTTDQSLHVGLIPPNTNSYQVSPYGTDQDQSGAASSDNLSALDQGHLQLLAARQFKKTNKALASAISSPLSAALLNLSTSDPVDALSMEAAIIARAKKPRSTSIDQIYRNPSLIVWDHPLLLACIQSLFYVEIARLKAVASPLARSQAAVVQQNIDNISGRLMRDQLKISAPALASSFNSMLQRDPSLMTIHSAYESSRSSLMLQHQNRIDGLNRVVGTCVDYSIKGNCTNDSCAFDHRCIFCNGPHPSYGCTSLSNRWTPFAQRRRNNNGGGNNRRRYNNNKRRGNGRGQQQRQDNYNGGYPQQQQQGYQYPPQSKDGNHQRYSQAKQ